MLMRREHLLGELSCWSCARLRFVPPPGIVFRGFRYLSPHMKQPTTPPTFSAKHLAVSVALLVNVLMCTPAFAEDDYDRLIRRAREGDTGPALAVLRQAGNNASPAQRFDHILIASWAGAPEEVADVYQRLPLSADVPPANVQLAAARALRDLKRWPEALAAWRTGLQQHPNERVSFAAGFIMTLADAGQGQEAIQIGRDWATRIPDHVDLRMALAYVHAAGQRPFDALHHTDKALQLAPDAPWVRREYAFVLQRVGMPRQGLEYARKHPGLLTPEQMRSLEADAIAVQTRLAAMPTRSEGERFVIADRALAQYDTQLTAWKALGAGAAADIVRLRIDRLSALHARVQMDELVREYEALLAEGVKVPVWALSNVASAYLYLREPEKARDLYQMALAELDTTTAPEDRNKLGPAATRLSHDIGLLYALTEAEQFAQTTPVLERIKHYGPVWLHFKGNPVPEPNPNYLEAQLTLVSARLAVDDTPGAQAQMEAMVEAAPNNTNLRANLAGVYRARAQPRRAEEQLKLAETMAPRSLTVENGQGMVALDLQEWRQAEQLSADSIARYPENQASKRLARQWEVHNKDELRISGAHGISSDNPVAGRGGLGFDAVYYTSPIGYNWRAFAGAGHSQSTFQEGVGRYNWQRGGIEWRGRDLTLEAEVSANSYGSERDTRTGARVAAIYDFNDDWRIGADAEQHSRRTPLRALRAGVSSDMLGVYARWRAHERREWQLSMSAARFSDDNQRLEFAVDGSERVYSSAHLKLDLLLGLSAQSNRLDDDRLYFNPGRTWMLLPGLRLGHILHRRYENVWEHSATLSAGAYHQRDYGSGGVFALSYGQRYRHHDVFEAGLAVNAIDRQYDGNREFETQLVFDLVSRF